MKNNFLKLGTVAAFALSASVLSAQQTTSGTALTDFAKQAEASPASGATGSVRVIDNKGTIKYLQASNGVTMLTNKVNDVTTTTWQLGGTLTDSTYIDVAGKVFALDGIALETGDASTNTDLELATTSHDDLPGTGTTGWTLLVRDEDSGAIKKLRATDLIKSGQTYFTVATLGETAFDLAAGTSASGTRGAIITTLVAAAPLPAFAQVSVYRNGAKLIAGFDYTITVPSTITLVPISAPTAITSRDWNTYVGDIIEVHYMK